MTMFGFLLPGLISGSVIFEQIFAWPGLGLLGYEAILARDFPMILTLTSSPQASRCSAFSSPTSCTPSSIRGFGCNEQRRSRSRAARPRRNAVSAGVALLRKDRLAVAGLYVLAALVVLALVGKLLTEWWVVFDPTTVRLPDKLRPPLSTPSSQLLSAQLPTWGIYPFGTDELGRNVFARMLQGSFISLSVGIVAVSISLVIGVSLGGIAGFYGQRNGGRSAWTALSCALPMSCCVFPHFS